MSEKYLTICCFIIVGVIIGQVLAMAVFLSPPYTSSDALIEKLSCESLNELYAEDFKFSDNFRHSTTTALGGIHNELVGHALENRCMSTSLSP